MLKSFMTCMRPSLKRHSLALKRPLSKLPHMDLFIGSEHSNLYHKFRPTYPDEVYDFMIKYVKEKNPTPDTVLDIGCGTGQSTIPLCKYFTHVTGVDISESQIEKARTTHTRKNVAFRVSSAEDLSFQPSDSVDLITVAQAMHWINPVPFYTEVSRVLREGGSLIIYGYGNSSTEDTATNEIIQKFYSEDLRGYWDSRRHHIDKCYMEFTLPFPNWFRNEEFVIQNEWSVDEVTGYLSTWSAWQTYLKKHPGSDILLNIHQQLKALYDNYGGQRKLAIQWPVFMLCGHKN